VSYDSPKKPTSRTSRRSNSNSDGEYGKTNHSVAVKATTISRGNNMHNRSTTSAVSSVGATYDPPKFKNSSEIIIGGKKEDLSNLMEEFDLEDSNKFPAANKPKRDIIQFEAPDPSENYKGMMGMNNMSGQSSVKSNMNYEMNQQSEGVMKFDPSEAMDHEEFNMAIRNEKEFKLGLDDSSLPQRFNNDVKRPTFEKNVIQDMQNFQMDDFLQGDFDDNNNDHRESANPTTNNPNMDNDNLDEFDW